MRIINCSIMLSLILATQYNFDEYLGKEDTVTEIKCTLSKCTSINGKVLLKFKNLERLIISGTSIEAFPLEICQLKDLNYLDLSKNQIKTIPKEIGQLQWLEELNLEGNQLSSIPEELCALSNLTLLNLSNNKIRKLPQRLGDLKSVFALYLKNNLIQEFPQGICRMRRLTILELAENQIELIPREIGNLGTLKILDLSSNKISKIPIEFTLLQNLESFLIGQNALTTFPLEVCVLNQLETLSLFENPLKSVVHSDEEVKIFRSEYEEFKASNYGNFEPFDDEFYLLSSADCIKILDEKMKAEKLGVFNLDKISLIAYSLGPRNLNQFVGAGIKKKFKALENEYDLKNGLTKKVASAKILNLPKTTAILTQNPNSTLRNVNFLTLTKAATVSAIDQRSSLRENKIQNTSITINSPSNNLNKKLVGATIDNFITSTANTVAINSKSGFSTTNNSKTILQKENITIKTVNLIISDKLTATDEDFDTSINSLIPYNLAKDISSDYKSASTVVQISVSQASLIPFRSNVAIDNDQTLSTNHHVITSTVVQESHLEDQISSTNHVIASTVVQESHLESSSEENVCNGCLPVDDIKEKAFKYLQKLKWFVHKAINSLNELIQ